MLLGQRGPKATPTGGVPFSIQDFADFFPPAKVGHSGSDSYDSTITDFEAERVAAEISLVDEASWDGLVRFVEGREVESAREEAAFLLISNHEAVLRDVTNANPTTQRDLVRVEAGNLLYADQALRETARRLLRKSKGSMCLPVRATRRLQQNAGRRVVVHRHLLVRAASRAPTTSGPAASPT